MKKHGGRPLIPVSGPYLEKQLRSQSFNEMLCEALAILGQEKFRKFCDELNKEHFIAHARRPGVTKKLSATKPLYSMKAGAGMRVVFAVQDESIVVLDVMRKVTMDRFVTKRRSKAHSVRKGGEKLSARRDEGAESLED